MSLFLMVLMKKIKNAVRLSLLPMTISLLILILFRFVFLLGYVPTASMEPALKTGSLLLGVRVWGDIQKGDIIVFRHNKEYLVKRVEAVEGDLIESNGENLVVPEGGFYVLGDNATDRRDNSGYKIWHCYCDCGNEIDVSYKALVYGNQQSCGCKKREHESELGTYLTHIDGTSIEALKSSKIPSNNTTGVRGVYCVKGRYKAKIVFQKKQFSLGTYDTLAEAATARKKAEKMLKSDVIAFYEQWTAKAAANPAWAKENPIHFQVTKNEAGELELQLAPKLDPETH